MKRNFNTKHSYIAPNLLKMKDTKKTMSSFVSSCKQVEASFIVSLRVIRWGKAHTIGEKLVLLTANFIPNSNMYVKCNVI